MNLEEMEKEINELKEHKHPEIIGKKDVYNLDFIGEEIKKVLRELYKLNPQLIINNQIIEKLDSKQTEKKEYKTIKYCSFYAGGEADGDCQLYGSGDITKSRKCKDIYCQYKDLGGSNKSIDSTHTLVQCPKCKYKYLISKEEIS